MKSSENADIINDDDEHASYAYQELEIDAFAFTKYYLEKYENLKDFNKIDKLDLYILEYINWSKDIL